MTTELNVGIIIYAVRMIKDKDFTSSWLDGHRTALGTQLDAKTSILSFGRLQLS